MNLSNYFQRLLLFTQLRYLYGTATQSPSFACAGDSITVSCVLTVPDAGAGDRFDSSRPSFIIGPTNATISENEVIGNGTSNGFDLSRFTAATNPGSVTEVSGSISLLSYINNTDEGLRMGCVNQYRAGGSGAAIPFIQALTLVQAAPLSPPSMLSISSSNIDPNTCSATVSLDWIPPSSTNRTVDRYYLSLQNGTALDSIAAPANSYSYNTNLLLDTVYAYSVSASSCAGNSTLDTSHLNLINSYSLSEMSGSSHCFDYDNVSNMFTINWGLSSESTPLLIQYSLRYNYSHSQGNVTVTSNANMMSTFSILSSDTLTHNQSILAANFVGTVEIETNITACLSITQQCGQPYTGNSNSTMYPPPPDTSVQTPTPTQSSSIPSPSSTYISPTPATTPAPTPANPSPDPLNTGLIAGVVLGLVGFLFILVVVLVLLAVCVYYLKSRDRKPEQSEKVNLGDRNQEQLPNPKPVKKIKLHYLDIDHTPHANAGKIVKSPSIPPTCYANIDHIETNQ